MTYVANRQTNQRSQKHNLLEKVIIIEKCALVNIQRGNVTRTEEIQLPDGNNIKDIDETGYKYLGIIEDEEIKLQEMKEKINKEYIKRLKAILKSKLNFGNTAKTINTWAVPVMSTVQAQLIGRTQNSAIWTGTPEKY